MDGSELAAASRLSQGRGGTHLPRGGLAMGLKVVRGGEKGAGRREAGGAASGRGRVQPQMAQISLIWDDGRLRRN